MIHKCDVIFYDTTSRMIIYVHFEVAKNISNKNRSNLIMYDKGAHLVHIIRMKWCTLQWANGTEWVNVETTINIILFIFWYLLK